MERGTFLNNKKIPCSIHESYAIMDRAEERKKIVFWFIVPLNKGKNSQRGVEVGLDLKTKSTCTLKSSCVRVCSLHFWQKVNHSQWIIFSLSLSFSSFFFFFGKSATTLGYDSLDITSTWQETLGLIQGPSAVLGATQTGDLDILNGELVVIGNFLIHIDVLLWIDDNLLLGLHCDDFSIAVWLKWEN